MARTGQFPINLPMRFSIQPTQKKGAILISQNVGYVGMHSYFLFLILLSAVNHVCKQARICVR